MKISIVLAAHNEGDALLKTIQSVVETAQDLDYEIILADDASTDGGPNEAAKRFPPVRLFRQTPRQGPSPAKHLGARNARGEILIFLDAHSKPERGALQRLARDVQDTDLQAIITPRIAALDTVRWQNRLGQVGDGYAFDLLTLDSHWVALPDLQKSPLGLGNLLESPALIGCAFAVSRLVYEKVWGFDAHMKYWGAEDLDFSLKCWLLGHPILHDPESVIGHRFQESFRSYAVPEEHILVNKFRLAYKNYTHAVWNEWLTLGQQQYAAPLPDHPEGLWACAWQLFKSDEASAMQERSFLHAHRVRDEFWYASRFGLEWPSLTTRGQELRTLRRAGPSPSPSPSPAPCAFSINGPGDVPGLTKYQYRIALGGQPATAISWSVDKGTAKFVGAVNTDTVTVEFANTSADWIKLRADFTVNGKRNCAEKQIALVKVTLANPTLTTPGKVSNTAGANLVFLVNPPGSGTPTWVTTHTPGSACAAFTYNGTNQAAETADLVRSNGGGGGDAFAASTSVTLTSPAQKPTAHQKIEIGYIQSGVDAGDATYATTPPPRKKRVITIPTTTSVDWLTSPCSPTANDIWPWYDASSRVTGTGSGSFTKIVTMGDSPSFGFPKQYNPNNAVDPNKSAALVSAQNSFAFKVAIAVRTLDTDLGADTHYFTEGQTTWTTNFLWPVTPGVSIVTTGPASWTVPPAADEISVNVVPTATNHNAPFLRMIP